MCSWGLAVQSSLRACSPFSQTAQFYPGLNLPTQQGKISDRPRTCRAVTGKRLLCQSPGFHAGALTHPFLNQRGCSRCTYKQPTGFQEGN